jgi:hypothetical protein
LGTKKGPKKAETIDEITDVEKLSKMKHDSVSRGKKQRIVKRIK